MEKHIVFFSHSTKDKNVLLKLKEEIDIKTGESLLIFLSSDGQSIPFGRNWVYEIGEALTKTSLMFVFISLNSLNSKWLYFESGYACSRGIDVVPIGILGFDLDGLTPPLSLLQGFNVSNTKSLGNIIDKINSTYKTKFSKEFTEEQYSRIFENESALKVLLPDCKIRFVISEAIGLDNINDIQNYLYDINSDVFITESRHILSNGIEIFERESDSSNNEFVFTFDGKLADLYIELLENLVKSFDLKVFKAEIILSSHYSYQNDFLTRSALLKNSEIHFCDHNKLTFNDQVFFIQYDANSTTIKISDPKIIITYSWVTNVIKNLLDTGILIYM
ncbi:MAG: toll/interleukin-1 receptor domain-containing protein [Chloroflexi bacterium]|nr:toll/interleukin-1 receptor domain-containing protein [Chloroflexota bacterium]